MQAVGVDSCVFQRSHESSLFHARASELTDVGKAWFQDHYPQDIVWEYDANKPFRLHAWAAEFMELTCLGIPYRIPPDVDGKPTVKKAAA